MPETRRNLLLTYAGVFAIVFAEPVVSRLFGQTPQPIPSPNAPNPNYPPGLEGPQATKNQDIRTFSPEKQKQLREDVERLYALASDLRNDIEKTNAEATLSLSVVNKAHEIEKLAKQIKNISKG